MYYLFDNNNTVKKISRTAHSLKYKKKKNKSYKNKFQQSLDLKQVKSKIYKHKKETLRTNWTLVLMNLKSSHANDYNILDEVA